VKVKEFKTYEEWKDYSYEQLSKCTDVEFVILKGHILIEYLLNYFIEESNLDLKESYQKFTFAEKVRMFEIFGNNASKKLIDYLKLVNKIRNEIAHSLEINDELKKQLLNIGRGEDELTEYLKLYPNDLAKTVAAMSFLLGYFKAFIDQHFIQVKISNEIIEKNKLEFYKRVFEEFDDKTPEITVDDK
jgi:hypothetical protein